MNTITIEANALKALMLFSSVKDVRYYLQCVHVETGPAGARLTATNGHVLAAHFIRGEYEVSEGIITSDLLANALKIAGKVAKIEICIEAGPYRPFYTVLGLRAEAIDGKYPNTSQLFKLGEPSGMAAQFDPQYLAILAKAAKDLGKPTRAHINHNGPENAALVSFGRDDFIAIIMPMRSESSGIVPAWATMALTPPAGEQAA